MMNSDFEIFEQSDDSGDDDEFGFECRHCGHEEAGFGTWSEAEDAARHHLEMEGVEP